MSCGEGVGRGAATCVCKGQTVFEGAVIGQVFTGDVKMHCTHQPLLANRCSVRSERQTEGAYPLSTALIALAIWQASCPVIEELTGSSSVLQAVGFFVAGISSRYLLPVVVARVRAVVAGALFWLTLGPR